MLDDIIGFVVRYMFLWHIDRLFVQQFVHLRLLSSTMFTRLLRVTCFKILSVFLIPHSVCVFWIPGCESRSQIVDSQFQIRVFNWRSVIPNHNSLVVNTKSWFSGFILRILDPKSQFQDFMLQIPRRSQVVDFGLYATYFGFLVAYSRSHNSLFISHKFPITLLISDLKSWIPELELQIPDFTNSLFGIP